MLEMAKYLDKDEAEYYTQIWLKDCLKAIIDNCAVKDSKSLTDFLFTAHTQKKNTV